MCAGTGSSAAGAEFFGAGAGAAAGTGFSLAQAASRAVRDKQSRRVYMAGSIAADSRRALI